VATKVGDPQTDRVLDELRAEIASRKPQQRMPVSFGCSEVGTTTTTVFMLPYAGGVAADATERFMPVPAAGKLENLRLAVVTPGTGAADVTFTVRVNGQDTVLSLGTTAVSSGVATATARSVPVKAGDRVSVSVRKSAAIAASPAHVLVLFELVVN
jgi:hypothetical protein